MRTRRYLTGFWLVLLLAGLAVGTAAVAARQSAPDPLPPATANVQQSDPASKISADLLRQFSALAPGGQAKYWVILADQADTRNNIPNTDWAAKGRYVYNTLRAKAAATQKPLLDQLTALQTTGSVSSTGSFWIINLIAVTGDRASAQMLASSPLVGPSRRRKRAASR